MKYRENYDVISRSHRVCGGLVMVSEEGRVFTSKSWFERNVRGTDRGYLVFQAKGKRYYLHREVAKAWVPNTEGLCFVRHIDGNKLNNRASNLEWYSPSGGDVRNLKRGRGGKPTLDQTSEFDDMDQTVSYD